MLPSDLGAMGLLRISDDIDLVDETLREGSERSSLSVGVDEKCELGAAIAAIGIRSLVVGMFPDVPHNIELLQCLVQAQQRGDIDERVRFLVISHVGETFRETMRVLDKLGEPLDNVWIVAIHGASDLQARYVFPKILQKDRTVRWDASAWAAATPDERRDRSLEWLDRFLPEVSRYQGGGIMAGLIDTFRADSDHVARMVGVVVGHGIRQIRLVDTAGTCVPPQVAPWLGPLVTTYPEIAFYAHFHDDFGLSSANALVALGCGARGVDVSVGGFANRAGHPALAEIAMALRLLYGVELPEFAYHQLLELSRRVERLYGLLERSTQPITGVITHAVQSGIRTELVGEARWVFDVIDPESIGTSLTRSFGVRSGTDGLRRMLAPHSERMASAGVQLTSDTISAVYERVIEQWEARSARVREELMLVMDRYHELLERASFTEEEVIECALAQVAAAPLTGSR